MCGRTGIGQALESVRKAAFAKFDETVEIARQLGLKTLVHIQNKGYGGNQKTCYMQALEDGAEIVVMLHPDYQYDSTLVPELIAELKKLGGEEVLVFVGGVIPPKDYAFLQDQGVSGVFGPGTPITDSANRILNALEG